jgi:hypothetical protein
MKRSFTGLVLLFLFLMTSCGGGSSTSSGIGTPDPSIPSVSNLTLSQVQNSGGGNLSFNMSFSFTDQGGDLSSVTVFAYDANGTIVAMNTTPLAGYAGQTTGTVTSVLTVSTATKGSFSGGVYVSDAGGRQSNRLSTTFTIS